MTETQLIIFVIILTVYRLALHVAPNWAIWGGPAFQAKAKETIDAIVWAGVVALLLIHFVVRSFYIPSESMVPTLQINDYILVDELLYKASRPSRDEIVVFHPPEESYDGDKTDLIKRVVAVEGDTVEVKDGHLWLNDLELDESFIADSMDGDFPKTTVEPGHIFVMGDNRNNSRDSRYIGQIPLENVVGRAELIFWPPRRAGLLH